MILAACRNLVPLSFSLLKRQLPSVLHHLDGKVPWHVRPSAREILGLRSPIHQSTLRDGAHPHAAM